MNKKIALLGMGTVGSGVVNLIRENEDLIHSSSGVNFTITHVLVTDKTKTRTADVSDIRVTDDITEIENADIDLVVEVMGGIDSTKDIINKFLKRGIPVVTANKDMLAVHIDELEKSAAQNNTALYYEAAVAGGIPIIHTMQHSLNANKISKVMGILNGTTNYILSKMAFDGWEYMDALKEAQAIGYAEADPTADVEGIDAARKTLLLARLAFDKKFTLDQVNLNGISNVDIKDIELAKSAGLTLKLLGVAEDLQGKYNLAVEPIFVETTHQLANVHYEKNAVFVNGNMIGEAMFYGPGAGSYETASAVVSDMINSAVIKTKAKNVPATIGELAEELPDSAYYLRFNESLHDVQSFLASLDVQFDIIDTQQAAFRTVKMSSAALQKIKDAFAVEAVYKINGAE
ncbi:MAG: homoserine dehydrogenase [Jeotgalicoccus sp.]